MVRCPAEAANSAYFAWGPAHRALGNRRPVSITAVSPSCFAEQARIRTHRSINLSCLQQPAFHHEYAPKNAEKAFEMEKSRLPANTNASGTRLLLLHRRHSSRLDAVGRARNEIKISGRRSSMGGAGVNGRRQPSTPPVPFRACKTPKYHVIRPVARKPPLAQGRKHSRRRFRKNRQYFAKTFNGASSGLALALGFFACLRHGRSYNRGVLAPGSGHAAKKEAARPKTGCSANSDVRLATKVGSARGKRKSRPRRKGPALFHTPG